MGVVDLVMIVGVRSFLAFTIIIRRRRFAIMSVAHTSDGIGTGRLLLSRIFLRTPGYDKIVDYTSPR